MAFIGISNWALDPAKMNRGILLSRGVPNINDLIKSAEGICSGNEHASRLMQRTIRELANGYSEVYKRQEREYFGLRDFYSLVKMVYATVCQTLEPPTKEEMTFAVQRNFGGYFGDFKPTNVFLTTIFSDASEDMFKPAKELVTHAIKQEGETRYILLL